MTVYAELLKLALAEDSMTDRSVPEMAHDLPALRADLETPTDAAGRLAASISYDVVLARLCDRYGVAHDLTGDSAGPVARRRAEAALAAVVPTLQVTLR